MSVPEIQLEQIIDYVGQEDDRMMAFYAVPARFSAPDTFGPEFLIATSSGTINYVGFGPATTAHTADTMDVDSGNAKSQGVPAVSLVNRFCIPVVQDTYPVNALSVLVQDGMAICLTAGTGRQNYVLFQQGRSLWGIGATIPSDGASSDCILRSDQVSKSQAANGAPATTIWNISAAFAGYDKVVYWWHIVLQISDAKVISCEVPTKRVYRGHSGPVRALAFHSAPRNTALFDTLASVSDDGAIRLWPAQAISDSNTAIAEFPIHRHDILAVNFKSQTIASGGKDCIVRIFDAPHLSKIHGHIISANTKRRDEALSQIATLPSSSVIHSLYLSEDASICLIGGGDGWLRVWRRGAAAQQGSTPVAPAYSLVHSQLLHSKALKSLAMPTDDCMVSLGADNVLRVWRVSNNNHSRQ